MTSSRSHSIHVDLDGAWPANVTEAYVDCRKWGGRLRYSATGRGIEDFYAFIRERTARFTLFGSGDYHHLSALWLRACEEPVTLVSFDNHPDWDIRPPHWCCGTWINRALELAHVRKVAIWGCGNFELNWPTYIFASREARQGRRVEIWPWTERLKNSGRKRFPGVTREDWREKFRDFARRCAGESLYVTIDLDCLQRGEAATNWENGLFEAAEIVWALGELRAHAKIVGGDLCGAYSPPNYERWKQRIESQLDHPRLPLVPVAEAAARNGRAREVLWGALAGG